MSNFTAGTWKYFQSLGVVYSKDTSAVIANVQGAGTESCFTCTLEGQANARLIATAPEMYAIVEWVASLAENQRATNAMIQEARELIKRVDDLNSEEAEDDAD